MTGPRPFNGARSTPKLRLLSGNFTDTIVRSAEAHVEVGALDPCRAAACCFSAALTMLDRLPEVERQLMLAAFGEVMIDAAREVGAARRHPDLGEVHRVVA